MPAVSITRESILDWLDQQEEVHGCGGATRNRYVAAFSLLYSVAGPDGNKKLAMRPWGRIGRRQEDNSRVRFLSPEEETAITAVLRERFPEYLPVFILTLHTDARTSEILRGVVGDFSEKTGMITIHQRKDKRKPKIRYVPASPMAIEAYRRLAAGRKKGIRSAPTGRAEISMSCATGWCRRSLVRDPLASRRYVQPYSHRRAVTGSTFAARRAGSQLASIVIRLTTSNAAVKETGSIAFIANS